MNSPAVQLTLKPDLRSRESVMVAAGRAQFSVTSTATRRTLYLHLKAWRPRADGPVTLDEATKVYVTERGYGTPAVATLNAPFDAATPADSSSHVWALQQVCRRVSGLPTHAGITIVSEDLCGLCGRRLVDPVSVLRGLGPECAGKPTGTRLLHVFKPDLQLTGS